MTEKRKLTPEEFRRCTETMLAIQSTCSHKHKTSYTSSLDGKYVTIKQCADCGIYNPGPYGFEPPSP